MLHRTFLALTLASACCSFLSTASAQPASADARPPVQPKEVRAWLMRIHDAASHSNFQGTFVVSAGGAVSSARIAHFCDGSNQFERIESLDGQARNVFRYNDVVHTVWPQARVALVEQRDLLNSFPALLQVGDDRIAEFYDLRPLGAERVAGHEANVLLLRPRDGNRFGYRLWADKGTGLLLRADVLGERGDVLETSAFSDVAIGVRSQPETILQPMKKLDGYRIVRPSLTPTKLEAEGWVMRQTVPGFREVSCVKRPLENAADTDQGGEPTHQALQTIYSDGLTYVSVFIEPFNPQRHTRAMLTSIGATQTLMRRQGDWWVTVIGDVPTVTLRAFANGLERTK
ncbi:MucB/RseB C-terminal domain-containing protein [Piscinibacter sp.]|jgi:sigma-E factor negative regulatory protein RseB|uniref:MucB/RseB C-terminal domain-containing protein n=1 Tax=Piscinibacter sp. TaxID=1903157 RepID=UPI00355A8B16